jgi:type IV fimbrial biogenesis protein FimT
MLMRATCTSSRKRMRGLTLIELLTVLTIVGILLVLALPGFGNWTRDVRVRTVSEDIANALRIAQAEAVSRNRRVAFVRTTVATPGLDSTPSTSGSNWYIQVLPLNSEETAQFVQGGRFGANDTAGISGAAMFCFNSAGRVINVTDPISGSTADCTAPTTAASPVILDVTLAGSNFATSTTGMRVELFLGGRSRLCNRNATAGQVNACT